MGVNSKYHRYREAGEAANVNNVERFGTPARSLFTSSKVISLHHKIEITDEQENVVYRSQSKFFTLHDKTDIFDASENKIAHIEKKIFTLHERHFITMEGGPSFQLSNELFHLIKDITNIEGLGWQLRGNIAGLNFELYDEKNEIVANISQKLISLHDKYIQAGIREDRRCDPHNAPAYDQGSGSPRVELFLLFLLEQLSRDREHVQYIPTTPGESAAAPTPGKFFKP